MYLAEIRPYTLQFLKPARTSRNTLSEKKIYILSLRYRDRISPAGTGEIGPFEGLSPDDSPDFESRLMGFVRQLNEGLRPEELDLEAFSSISFGLETARRDLENGGEGCVFRNSFYEGKQQIPINGLVWMGDTTDMLGQVAEKVQDGFTCIKLKVGALDFDEECRLLEQIRRKYNAFRIEIRLDANGAFPFSDALSMLKELRRFEIHSIEQPIRAGQWEAMAEICERSSIPVALDEELIGLRGESMEKLLPLLKAPYIILKPGILGGFDISRRWIELARRNNTGWWITSALESNIGLSAIAQFCAEFSTDIPQGLGTGKLYANNFASPLFIKNAHIAYDPEKKAEWSKLWAS